MMKWRGFRFREEKRRREERKKTHDRSPARASLRANPDRITRVLNVDARDEGARFRQDGAADAEVGVGTCGLEGGRGVLV